jgi:hypothetical protein
MRNPFARSLEPLETPDAQQQWTLGYTTTRYDRLPSAARMDELEVIENTLIRELAAVSTYLVMVESFGRHPTQNGRCSASFRNSRL